MRVNTLKNQHKLSYIKCQKVKQTQSNCTLNKRSRWSEHSYPIWRVCHVLAPMFMSIFKHTCKSVSMAEPAVTHIQQPMRAVRSHAHINGCNNVCSARWPPVFVFLLIGNTWRYLNPLFTLQRATWVAKNGKQHLVVPQKQAWVCARACFLPLLCCFTPACASFSNGQTCSPDAITTDQ